MRLNNFFVTMQNGNGPGRDTPACDTPNPPFWCDDVGEPAAFIDANLWVLFALGIVLIIVINLNKSHWKALKAWLKAWSKACPNETKW